MLAKEVCGNTKITYQGTEIDFSTFYEFDYTNSLNKELNCDILSIKDVEEFKNKYRLIDRKQAYYYDHFPNNNEEIHQAYRYLKYE